MYIYILKKEAMLFILNNCFRSINNNAIKQENILRKQLSFGT